MGSLERFFGVLIEHYAGAFPVWLAPVQAVICTITDRATEYALKAAEDLRAAGVRVEADVRNEKIGYKIREATLQKVPYILVVGDKEMEAGTLAVRLRDGKDLGPMPAADFIAKIVKEDKERTI
jgi:threonyl-tRNA synthetase